MKVYSDLILASTQIQPGNQTLIRHPPRPGKKKTYTGQKLAPLGASYRFGLTLARAIEASAENIE